MKTTVNMDVDTRYKRAELLVREASEAAPRLGQYLAAVELFGQPALEIGGGERLDHATWIAKEALEVAECVVDCLTILAGDLRELAKAADQ